MIKTRITILAFLILAAGSSFSQSFQKTYSKKVIEKIYYADGDTLSDTLFEKRIRYYDQDDSLRIEEIYRSNKLDEKREYCYCKQRSDYSSISLCASISEAVQRYEDFDVESTISKGIEFSTDYATFLETIFVYGDNGKTMSVYHFNSSGHLVTKTTRSWSGNTVTHLRYETTPDGKLIPRD